MILLTSVNDYLPMMGLALLHSVFRSSVMS